jgi:CRISP-associated protein Cas1
VQRRVRQYRALADEAICLRLTKALVHAKVEGQHRYLLRATRGGAEARENLLPALSGIQDSLRAVSSAADRDSLRGHEGTAAVHYFHGLRSLLGSQVPEELRSETRNRRPPVDRFNALLSYGYGLLHTAVMRAVLAAGLEPALGFYHTPRSAAYPLVLDLMELFRVTLWDLVLVGSLNRGQWDPEADFAVTRAKVWLSEAGRKKAIGLFEARLEETWKHPVLNYSLSYARTIELEARLLEKEWTGEPGLFARSRLR